jgi:Xaa-Pro aminopeptidase
MVYRIEKINRIAEDHDLDAFLFTSPLSVRYLCGYFYNFEIGPSPFQLLPAALFVIPAKTTTLVIADNETDQLSRLDKRLSVSQYASYVYEKPLDYSAQFLVKLNELIKNSGLSAARIGIEPDSLPHRITYSLLSDFKKIKFVDISDEIAQLRMIKEEDELVLIREAVHLCDIGQEAVLKYTRPGISEIELFTLVRGDMDAAAGKRIPMMADLVAGQRTYEGGGNPSANIISDGDLVLSDLTPCLNGYWGDTCNTVSAGKPSVTRSEHFKMVQEALYLGISAVKPGVPASAIDQIMRKHLEPAGEYKHHSGHGVGLAYHEEPRIVPYNNTALAAGMVIALEPAIYTDGYGVRLEHLLEVIPSGCKILSKFVHRMER